MKWFSVVRAVCIPPHEVRWSSRTVCIDDVRWCGAIREFHGWWRFGLKCFFKWKEEIVLVFRVPVILSTTELSKRFVLHVWEAVAASMHCSVSGVCSPVCSSQANLLEYRTYILFYFCWRELLLHFLVFGYKHFCKKLFCLIVRSYRIEMFSKTIHSLLLYLNWEIIVSFSQTSVCLGLV